MFSAQPLSHMAIPIPSFLRKHLILTFSLVHCYGLFHWRSLLSILFLLMYYCPLLQVLPIYFYAMHCYWTFRRSIQGSLVSLASSYCISIVFAFLSVGVVFYPIVNVPSEHCCSSIVFLATLDSGGDVCSFLLYLLSGHSPSAFLFYCRFSK
jgi:hypothetical protein